MAWFAVLFAIINLLLAYGLVRLYTSLTASEHGALSEVPKIPPAAAEPVKNPPPQAPTSGSINPANPKQRDVNVLRTSAENAVVMKAAAQAQPSAPQWQDQLQAIGQRIHYAHSVGERHLAKDAAVQVRDWAVSWQRHLQGSLMDGTPADADQVEMCLAQIESTLSNLDAISWSEAVDTACRRLEQEFGLLEKAASTLAQD
ncbi:MAG TPA: hypothetical protein VG826_26515 [Pirellulales bacterium]|nr:hypothetical protein [Pirellulales bacterium]